MAIDLMRLDGMRLELEQLHHRCISQLLKTEEARAELARLNTAVREVLPQEGDEYRVYDRLMKGCHAWWKKNLSGYIDVKDCKNVACQLEALRSVLARLSPEFVASDRPSRDETYFPAGQNFAARQMLFNLMTRAARDLIFVDKYLDHDIFNFLQAVDPAVAIRLMTEHPKDSFKSQLTPFRSSGRNVEARLINGPHDRFVILDRTEVWQIGASLNGFGKDAFRISRVLTPSQGREILDDLDSLWAKGMDL